LPFDLNKPKITTNIPGKRYIILEKDYKIHTLNTAVIKHLFTGYNKDPYWGGLFRRKRNCHITDEVSSVSDVFP